MITISLCLTVLAILTHCNGQEDSKQVKIVLNSNWPNTPVILEASEFLAEVDEVLFWNFIQKISNIEDFDSLTERDQYEATLTVAESLLNPSLFKILPFSLAVRIHSPKVQMFQQVSSEVFSNSFINSRNSCALFGMIGDAITCDIDKIKDPVFQSSTSTALVYSFDHCYSSTESSIPTVIIHGEVGTAQFTSVFNSLWPEAESGGMRICLRHWRSNEPSEMVRLSGYGVQLAVKSTEYKAVDDTKIEEGARSDDDGQSKEEKVEEVDGFIFSTLKTRYPDLTDKLSEFHKHLIGSRRELPELKAWQITDLGVQAVQRIIEAEDPLREMRDLSQNLPVLAKSLSHLKVDNSLKLGIEYNQRLLETIGVHPGASILLLNGILIQEDDFNVFSLLNHIKSESRILSGLKRLKLPSFSYRNILSAKVHPTHTKYTVDMRSELVMFINNIEKDPMYSSFSPSVYDFLRPAFPGSLRSIRKNAFNMVFMFDPLSLSGIELIEYIGLFYEHKSPFRLGILLVPSGCGNDHSSNSDHSLSEVFSTVLTYLLKTKHPIEVVKWVLSFNVEDDVLAIEDISTSITLDTITRSLKNMFSLSQNEISTIISDTSEYRKLVEDSCSFMISKGLPSPPQVLINGVLLDLENEDIETAIVSEVQRQTSEIQQLVFSKRINDVTNIYDFFMKRSNVMTRLNKHVTDTSAKQIDLSDIALSLTDDDQGPSAGMMSVRQLSATVRDEMTYFTSLEGEFENKALTFWIIADFDSKEGRDLAVTAIDYTSTRDDVRLAFLHNPAAVATPSSTNHDRCSLYLESLLTSQRPKVVHDLIKPLLQRGCDNEEMFKDVVSSNEKFKNAAFESKVNNLLSSEQLLTIRSAFIQNVLGMMPGQRAILSNGRLVGPFNENERFLEADFTVLYAFEFDSHAKVVSDLIQDLVLPDLDPDSDTAEFRSELVMRVSSLRRSEQKQKRMELPKLKQGESVVNVQNENDPSAPSMDVVVIIDPLSSAAQKLSAILSTLIKILPCNVTLIMNPPTQLSEVPLTDFYRSVLEPSLSFNEDGSLSSGPSAVFSSLPQSPLFTLSLDVPHSWMVQSTYSPYDLDNIHMASVEREVYAEYNLEYILVEGQCFDDRSESPTPGIEYVMGTNREPNLYDTIVMANLGYFQLKGKPGAWNLKLRDGRSSDVYQISSYQQNGGASNTSSNQAIIPITIDSFNGAVLVVKVEKRPGMEKENLLKPDDEEEVKEDKKETDGDEGDGFMGSMFGSLFGDSDEKKDHNEDSITVPQNETINIFSLASGHLYERFLRIMMLSVLKHTQNPVKFWFLENFLSPTFKDFIPKMAKEYGFEYELVQYKWPRWLLAQTQKQRIIWGYKILFLDVLFPLNVKKIIFVDADQIVRTDMKELLEVPLDGAPYGYTPFCDSRKEMDGFRFWNSGYWRNHLGRRPYHISALYVIDLQRFRLISAGDRLRGQYQMLSQDPNSLSNLDQDLPNNMIHNVPIKSLPQEWLWCETWCSDESKATAKTIDLCNNPLTKEPKLKSAMRIVPEWKDYDEEIKQLQEKVSATSRQASTPVETHRIHKEL